MQEKRSEKMQEKETKREPFFIVPSRVFDLELTPYELAVLFYLMMRADNETHTCFPSVTGIAERCGVSVRKVRDVLHSLEEKQIIAIKAKYVSTKKNFNRQTSNYYTINIFNTPIAQYAAPHGTPCIPPVHNMQSPPAQYAGEINKTKPNRTKTNITISTLTTVDEAAEIEKVRFSFLELKRECFEILKNERDIDEEYVALLDRALEHLWFKNGAEYEGRKYAQSELRELLKEKTTPEVLCASVEFLSASKEPVRSPVAYLGKCILGLLVNGVPVSKKSDFPLPTVAGGEASNLIQSANESSFSVDDFFAAALRNTYGDDFEL